MDENNSEEKIEELRNRLQSIEWDMKTGSFSKDKTNYYKKLLEEYEEIKEKQKKLVV